MKYPKYPSSWQCKMLVGLLEQGRTVTPIDALNSFRCFRLSERVRELEVLGWKIERGWVKTPGGARVRTYRIA